MADDGTRGAAGSSAEARFVIPLPDGRIARVPYAVLVDYVDSAALAAHLDPLDDDTDVTAHDMKPDEATGVSDYHTDWERGECYYEDGSGNPQRIFAWHRHPFGTEYAEIYEG